MRSNRGTWTAAAVSLLLLTAGCAGDRAGAPSARGDTSSAPGETGEAPVLRVDQVGGFLGAAAAAVRIPSVSIYADGRVITPGPVLMIYPGPALPNLLVRRISPDAVKTLVDKAAATGVPSGTDLGRPGVTDAPTTRFTFVTGGKPQTVDVYALAEAPADATGISAEQKGARQKMTDLMLQLTDLNATLGAGKAGPEAPYVPHALAAVAGPWQAPQEPGITPPPAKAWPGPALPGTPMAGGAQLGCTTVTGDAVLKVLAAAADAKQTTPWTVGDKQYSVTFRPLLPDEIDCDTLRVKQ